MSLVSVSQQEIEDRVIDYFAGHFGDKPSDLSPATNIPKTYNLGAPEWAMFADVLSKLAWMVKLKVRLAQKEMVTVPQIQQLAHLIVGKMKHVVVIPTSKTKVLSLTKFLAAKKPKPKAAAKKAKPKAVAKKPSGKQPARKPPSQKKKPLKKTSSQNP